jgi:hypothetical protein
MKKVMDTVTKTNVLTALMLTNAKPWKGRTLDKAIQVTAPTTGGSFSGLDTFDTTQSNTKVRMSYDPRAYRQTIVLPGLERDVAGADPNAAVDYVVEAVEEGANAMAQAVGAIFYINGTGNSNKDFLGLKACVDDGTEVTTLGGLNRYTTYTSLQSYRQATGAGLTSLTAIYTAINATEQYSVELGKKIIITTRALWSNLEALIQPTILSNVQSDGYKMITRNGTELANRSGLKGEVGFNALYIRGIPVVADDKCTANYLYIINTDFLNFYGIQTVPEGYRSIDMGGNKEIEGMYGDESAKNVGAIFTNFIKPVNQYGEVGHIILRGNLATFNPNRHAVLVYS